MYSVYIYIYIYCRCCIPYIYIYSVYICIHIYTHTTWRTNTTCIVYMILPHSKYTIHSRYYIIHTLYMYYTYYTMYTLHIISLSLSLYIYIYIVHCISHRVYDGTNVPGVLSYYAGGAAPRQPSTRSRYSMVHTIWSTVHSILFLW